MTGDRRPALEALIFDVDGTLADTERDGHRVAFNLAFAECGLDWHWDEALYTELLAVAGGRERIVRYARGRLRGARSESDVAALAAEIHRVKTRHYQRLLAEGRIALRCGVARLLDEARHAGLRLAVATTTEPENVSRLVEQTLGAGAEELFEVIGAGDVVPRKKPAPDIYRFVLDHMRLPAAACIAFEDSAIGLAAALGAGVITVVTVNAHTRGQRFDGAALVVDRLGEPGGAPLVLAGSMPAGRVVDVAVLRELHAAAWFGRSGRG